MIRARAITLDLDNTLWEIGPVIERAEQRIVEHLAEAHPRIMERYDAEGLRAARARMNTDFPDLAHDMTALRHRMFTVILEECGYEVSHADGLMERFLELRHDVELFPDVLPALERLAARYPMASLSNGNADIRRLGLDRYMPVAVSAGHAGTAKPDPAIFLHACDALGFAPREVVHVGDHPVEDVRGARDAGMVTVWINRGGAAWEHDHRADFEVSDLAGLVALLEAL